MVLESRGRCKNLGGGKCGKAVKLPRDAGAALLKSKSRTACPCKLFCPGPYKGEFQWREETARALDQSFHRPSLLVGVADRDHRRNLRSNYVVQAAIVRITVSGALVRTQSARCVRAGDISAARQRVRGHAHSNAASGDAGRPCPTSSSSEHRHWRRTSRSKPP